MSMPDIGLKDNFPCFKSFSTFPKFCFFGSCQNFFETQLYFWTFFFLVFSHSSNPKGVFFLSMNGFDWGRRKGRRRERRRSHQLKIEADILHHRISIAGILQWIFFTKSMSKSIGTMMLKSFSQLALPAKGDQQGFYCLARWS